MTIRNDAGSDLVEAARQQEEQVAVSSTQVVAPREVRALPIFLPSIFLPFGSIWQHDDQGRGAPFATFTDSCIHAVGCGTPANALGRRR
jgi:hypothetical protein